MRGINYKHLTQNWKAIIDKICEETSPYDVLSIVIEHLSRTSKTAEKIGFKFKNIDEAIEHIKAGMQKIDPEH